METEPERLDVSTLAAQPIAYWTWATTRVLLQHVRSSLARVDVTQQQWWTLNYVDAAENGLTRAQVCDRLDAFLDEVSPEDMGHAVDSLLHRGWLTADDADRLTLTDAGRDAKVRIKDLVAELRSEIHEGITDKEYAATLTILQRMIRNVGGTATPR